MQLRGQEHLERFTLPKGDLELNIIPLSAPGEERVLPPIFPGFYVFLWGG